MTGARWRGEKGLGGRAGLASDILALCGAGAVAVLACAALPAAAQTAVLISNMGQAEDDAQLFDTSIAQRFRTGGNSGGYTVTSIELNTGGFNASSTASDYPTVTLRSGSETGTVLATFTKPPDGSASVIEYTLSSSIDLAASTTYWIKAEAISSSGDTWISTATTTTDSGTQTGWSIPGKGQSYNTTTMAWQEYAGNAYRMFRVNGTVNPNAAPASSDNTITLDQNTSKIFAASDFNFSDTDSGATLASVRITALETAGDLELDGMDVTLNQVIGRSAIDAGKLTFSPSAGATGDPYATFGFKVNDGGADSTAEYTMTIVVVPAVSNNGVAGAWLPRFGRSVAQQVVERVSRRLRQRPQAGLEVSVAGEELSNRGPWEEEQGIMAKLLGFETVSEGQLVEGTEFAFSPQQQEHGEGHGEGEGLVFWGGGELSSFNGRQDTISLSGDVTTALVGADWHRQRWSAGAAVAYGWGNGGYEEGGSGGGTLSSSLTGLFPYGRYALNDRLTLQGVVGHSWGRLSLSPEGGEQQSTNIQMSMGALGLDGLLLDGGGEGLTIRSTADALLLGVSSEKTQALAGVQGDVSRLRLGLEAERPFPMPQSDAVLTPSLALAIRQDGGDAETGFGLEAAAALLWTDPLRGMEVELRGRTMVSHGDQSFHEQGFGLSLSWDPNPSSPLGPSLSLSQGMGASPVGGVEALLSRSTMEELSATGDGGGGLEQRLEARWAYGFPSHDNALVITPELGVALSGDGATTTMGFSFSPLPRQNDAWQVVLQGQRQLGSRSRQAPDHSLGLRFSLLF